MRLNTKRRRHEAAGTAKVMLPETALCGLRSAEIKNVTVLQCLLKMSQFYNCCSLRSHVTPGRLFIALFTPSSRAGVRRTAAKVLLQARGGYRKTDSPGDGV
jgi:hypothetical protein